MVDPLDEDVRILKAWIDQAWRYLGQPMLTRFERREMRNQMKDADAALRLGLQKCAERDRGQRECIKDHHRPDSINEYQNMRLLNIDVIPSRHP
ncbi:hypothetical protein [Bradyrhizobium sp. McL0616]|uniref:hypothetical protein n=1 Tax=Bradyrhizobium sp. McL0616 TaxID=3415674 RepID=UPI003CE94F3B